MIVFATRAGLAARRDVVDVLHLAGAEDGFIARLFQAALRAAGGPRRRRGRGARRRWSPRLRLSGGGQGLTAGAAGGLERPVWLIPCPLIAAAIAAAAARLVAAAAC